MAIYKISYNVSLDFRPYIPTEEEYLLIKTKLNKNKKFLLNNRYKPVKLKQKHPFFWLLTNVFGLLLALLLISIILNKFVTISSINNLIEEIMVWVLLSSVVFGLVIGIMSFKTDGFYADQRAREIWLILLDPYFKGEQRKNSSMSHYDNYEGFKYFLYLDYEQLVMKYNSELQKPH
jgi:hypothetical protein